jgi:hypothetical protein
MKNRGLKNEKQLLNALHRKKYHQLNSNLQRLIALSFEKYTQPKIL